MGLHAGTRQANWGLSVGYAKRAVVFKWNSAVGTDVPSLA